MRREIQLEGGIYFAGEVNSPPGRPHCQGFTLIEFPCRAPFMPRGDVRLAAIEELPQ
jgi:hypothetical protein